MTRSYYRKESAASLPKGSKATCTNTMINCDVLLILAAFEEFKSQMQQHLSQVEERMVLLEAENRTLKGKM